ncbi:MAG: aspartate kinase [Bacteroidales bacterium]|nr:aspartate kinase [Bacteroidales bacterium]
MKVLKFGGTSVGTIESLTNVKKIVDGLDRPAVVVVSALGGLTDRLISTAKAASEGKDSFEEAMIEFRLRHHNIIEALVPEVKRVETRKKVDTLLDQLGDIYRGLYQSKTLPERTLDLVVSFGERMSSIIVAELLKEAEHKDSLSFMRTERWFNKNIADRALTEKLIKEAFPLPLEKTVVTGGFISRDRDSKEITNLGRGGSDYTAALIAAALDAEELEIWTDVDGFLTTDPRVVKEARIIPTMTFVESMELCTYGAKVVYPPTIYPVFHKGIPIRILNTFNPEAPGTLITDNIEGGVAVRGVSALAKNGLIKIEGALAGNVATVNTRAFNAMSRNGISVLLVGKVDHSQEVSLIVPIDEMEKALRLLKNEFAGELQNGDILSINGEAEVTVIAVVGEQIKQLAGLGARLTNTLWRNNISVKAVSDGASETTIGIVVDSSQEKQALALIHEAAIERR